MAVPTKHRSPELPLEIWIKVLTILGTEKHSAVTLWTDYRQVCKLFRDVVDLVFVTMHLPKTWLSFDLGLERSEEHGNVVMDTHFSFVGLSDDRKLAVFQGEKAIEPLRNLQNQLLKDVLEAATVEKPAPYVQFRRQIYDTEVPALKINYESLEMTCDWRGMYSAWFAEEQQYNKKIKSWVDMQETWIKEMQAKEGRGEIDPSESIQLAITMYAKQSETIEREVRRARIRRQYLEKHNRQWKPTEIDYRTERLVLKRLKDKRFVVGMEEYSDDKVEDDEEPTENDLMDEGEDEDEELDDEEAEEDEERDEMEDVET